MSIDDEIMGRNAEQEAPAEEVQTATRPSFALPEWVKAQTGSGAVEDYLDHALNFNQSKGLARIIRGMSGIIGEMNYAIVDIALGILEFMKPKRPLIKAPPIFHERVNGDAS